MIDDPIVIRKSRGLLVVSSSIPTDPIQLVRELSHDKLEVHLKNGTKYVEELHESDDIQEIILEMMGYGTVEVTFGFHCWPKSQDGTLEFYENEEDMERIGKHMVNHIFSNTPYMNSKYLWMDLSDIDEKSNIKYYDSIYSQYDVEFVLAFRARVDAAKKIEEAFQSQLYNMSDWLVKKRGTYNDVGVNECWCSVHVLED